MYARIGAFLVAIALAFTGLASAQETTGSVSGRIVDGQGLAVPGVTVTVSGPQGSRSVTTDAEGRYTAALLVPGTYSVRAELQGFRAAEATNVTVSLGQTTNINVTMQVGGLTETVEVSAVAPTIDTTSTTIGNVLDSATLERLPIGRSLASTLYVVPGVTMSVGLNLAGGNANPSIAGASGLENIYVIDGVNITDTGFGGFGAYNSIFGSLGAGVTSSFIKETEIKTGGFEAEFGQTTGGVVNVVTKSGSNLFAGSLFGYTRPSSLEASWKELVTPNGTVNTQSVDDHDIGLSVGGPIVSDRVFFFATYNPQWQQRGFSAPAGFPYASLGTVNRERTIQAYAGKLSMQMNSTNRLDVSVFGDPSKGHSGLQRYTTLRRIAAADAPGTRDIEGGFSELQYGGHNQTARYDGIFGSRWLVEGSVARASSKFWEIPTTDSWIYTDLRTTPNGTTGGLGSYERDNGSNFQYGLKSTHILSGLGSHQIRYGIGFETIEFTRDFDYRGSNLLLGDGRTTVTGGPIQIRTGGGVTFFRATRGKLVPTDVTNQDGFNFFLQDTWQMGRLTLRPGVRYERQQLTGVDPAGDNPDLCFEDDSRPGQGDGTGAAIPCSFAWKNLAPRLGFTYDLTGTGRAKVFGSYGRFYAKIPNDLAARAMSADAGITRQNYVDAALTQPLANGTLFAGSTTNLLTAGLHAAPIDPESGSTYKNEILAGLEFDVLPSTVLGFSFIRRDMPQILEDISDLPLVGYFLSACGTASVEYAILNVTEDVPTVSCGGVLTSSFENPRHSYNAFEVTLNRRFSGNWSAIASYRYSQLEGNFEGFFRSDNGQSDPAITSLFDFPTNDPTYTAMADVHGGDGDIRFQGDSLGTGVLPNDRPHQLKLYGNYLLGNLNIGLGFNAISGSSLTALAGNAAYANAGEIPLTIRGEGIETVDGFMTRTPAEVALDLHADYGLQLGGQRLTLLADVFNLFNRRAALNYDNWSEITFGAVNPNFGQPSLGGGASTNSYQAPMSIRLGARFDW